MKFGHNNVVEWSKIWGMNFNITKCVQMTVTNKRNIVSHNYYLNNTILEKKDMIKYLSITIDNKLTFNQHIYDKTKKATTVLNMLKRNLFFAPKSVKRKAYQACSQPILEYASTCWAPTFKKLSETLENVHHTAAKFVSNIYHKKGKYEHFSITQLLENLNWRSLEKRRQEARLTMANKIINGQVILEPELLPKAEYKRPMRQCNEA